jgi:hypothetical protein
MNFQKWTGVGPKREEVAGGWRRLHNEDVHDFHTLPNVIVVIKWRKMRWAGNVTCMREIRNVYQTLV